MSTKLPAAEFERIEEEAAVWAARLHGGAMTDTDRAALSVWLEQNPEHRWILSRYRELTTQLDGEMGAAPETTEAAEFAAQPRRWRRLVIVTAAAAAIVIMVTMLAGRPREFATKTAERHLAALADGSRVELNARTMLAVDFGKTERHVRMTRGEALFSVAKDPARPFVVETPAGTVRVTGTVFNVRAVSSARIEVTVLEGTVNVRAVGAPAAGATGAAVHDATLTPGRQAMMQADHVDVSTLPEAAVEDVTAWRDGRVVFAGTPLADALERFAAYHTRTITVEAGAADLRLGGRFSLDDLEGFLDLAQRVLPVRLTRTGGTVTISRAVEK